MAEDHVQALAEQLGQLIGHRRYKLFSGHISESFRQTLQAFEAEMTRQNVVSDETKARRFPGQGVLLV